MAASTLKKLGRLMARLLGVAVLVGVVVGLGWAGWQWQSHATVGRVAVTGAQHVPTDTLGHLARIDSGVTMGTLAPHLIADRVVRHPWVKGVDVRRRWSSGTVELAVTERTPAALVVDHTGRPGYYLDAAGYAMPLVDGAAYDVPLVHGLDADYHPMQPIAPPMLRKTLHALANVGDSGTLVSAVVLQPDDTVQLLTAPVGGHESLPVLLRRDSLSVQLRQLRAFARRVLATRPDAPVGQIDLRFANQIVTREQPIDG